jgi:hypothetical protein
MKRILAITLVLAAGAVSAPALAQPTNLDLTCQGRGMAKQLVKNYFKTDKKDPDYVQRPNRIDGVARVRVRGDLAEIMLPPGMSVNKGWQKVKKLVVSDTEIRGSVQVALLSSAKLSIDRMGGSLLLDGDQGNFSGQCRAADPNYRAF